MFDKLLDKTYYLYLQSTILNNKPGSFLRIFNTRFIKVLDCSLVGSKKTLRL